MTFLDDASEGDSIFLQRSVELVNTRLPSEDAASCDNICTATVNIVLHWVNAEDEIGQWTAPISIDEIGETFVMLVYD